MLSFRLIPNGLGHFLFIDLIPCLTRIWVFHVAMPRSEIISVIYISSVLVLCWIFWWRWSLMEAWCCMSPGWKLPAALSDSNSSYPLSTEYERKVNADPTIRGEGWSQQFHLWVNICKRVGVWDQLMNVRTRVDRKFHLPFWVYHLFFFHPGCNLRMYLHVISGFKKNKEKKVESQFHNSFFSSSKTPSCPHLSLLPSLQELSFL